MHVQWCTLIHPPHFVTKIMTLAIFVVTGVTIDPFTTTIHCMRQAYTPLAQSDTPQQQRPRRVRRIPFRYLVASILFVAIPLTFVLGLAIFNSGGRLMRLCLPINLQRISTKLHKQLSCSPVPPSLAANVSSFSSSSTSTSNPTMTATVDSTTQPGRVADFILSQKEAFLADAASKNLKGWTVITGNEAGGESRDQTKISDTDLDSLSSSIAFAYLDNTLNGNRSLPLTLTPRSKMNLRPENLLALQRCHIPPSVLLHPEDIPGGTEGLISAGAKVGLVDHNSLLPRFGGESDYNKVSSIVDHHEDEGVCLEANPRIIKVPTGSTSSLVTNYFTPGWKAALSSPAGVNAGPPPELATLLLSSLLIDTHGLKAGGKATQDDYDAANFLYGVSTLPQVEALGNGETDVSPELTKFATELVDTKYNVAGMTVTQLLERDYKQYPWDTASTRFPLLNVGLSTVPMSLKDQLKSEGSSWQKYLATVDAFMVDTGIDVVGVLTTFKSSKGKSRRELLVIVRAGGSLPDIEAAQEVLGAIAKGLEADTEVFGLEPWAGKEGSKTEELAKQAEAAINSATRVGKAWNQGNHRSTRKQVAPAMHAIISALQ